MYPGTCIANLYRDSNIYTIGYFLVNNGWLRQGYGKELLHRAADHAASLGATAIDASIVSRESLDTMKSVFGEEFIDIESVGPYGDKKQKYTRAQLLYPL